MPAVIAGKLGLGRILAVGRRRSGGPFNSMVVVVMRGSAAGAAGSSALC